MTMRMTGLMSGLDTESIIQELVSSRQTKVDNAVKAQTKLEWKQDAWKSLNTKLKNLQSKYISNMRFSSSYSKRVTKVSNESAVSVITGENAVNGVQSLKVKELAKTGYLTGAEISKADGSDLIATDKISDIISGFSGTGNISVQVAGKKVDIAVTAATSISDILNQVKNAGLNASFDAKNQRFFISSKESGADNDFSITASDATGANVLSALGLQVNLNDDKATLAQYQEYASYLTDTTKMQTAIDTEVASRVSSYLDAYKTAKTSLKTALDKKAEIEAKYTDKSLDDTIADKEAEIAAKEAEIEAMEDGEDKTEAEEKLTALKKELETYNADKTSLANQENTITEMNTKIADIESNVAITETTDADGNVTYSAVAMDALKETVTLEYQAKAEYASTVLANYDPNDTTGTGATKVSGQDAVIELNGATFTNNTNVFEINGLTFTALSKTADGEEVTITTQDDVDGIYDMVKNFFKEYNAIINEMDKLYNADSAKDYEPLTDEEKEAMSESEIEKYEEKIKSALLRRDSNLSNISSALKGTLSSGIEINGKTMYLSDFGIATLGYFDAADNEKYAYHIAGDEDDADTSGKSDVLKSMISSDPDTVISFFTQMSRNLYSKMSSLSKSVDGYRSYGNFYDDKKMKSDYDDYTTKIEELEDKLADYEDKWYEKFAAMETALAKMQSNTNAITSLLGG